DPAVGAEDWAERAELEPARVELARLGHRVEEPADVGAPVRYAREPRVQAERDLRVQRREVVVDVARPRDGAEALHPGRARAAHQQHPLIGPCRGLALGERLVAEAIVDVVQPRAVTGGERGGGRRSLAAVEPPATDTETDQGAVRRPPPAAHLGVREIEVALALAIVGRAGGLALVTGREQV